VICNTIAQSRWLFNELERTFPASDLIYLSSSLLPPMRRWNIRRIKTSQKRKIVVSTQVVEAGVDIDLDVVYRDFAPLDSINQSAGRCNRNAKRGTGKVKLFNLGKHKHIYDPVLMNITQEVLDKFGDEILEGQLFDLNNTYAAAVRKKITNDSNESQKLIAAMQKLQLETVAESFQLIEEDHRHYNVFLPCCKGAKNVWEKYQKASQEINDPYQRKTEMKKLKPLLLQYVTRFPKNKYDPEDTKAFLIYEPKWKNWYTLDKGFRIDAKEDISLIV
jgi:CRISPR-associated endonuclease/helicase Cas3